MSDGYRTDLAFIHDAGYGALAHDAAKRLIAELQRAGHRDGTVTDLGCGSGVLAAALLEAGYRVVGIDMSDAMVELARSRAPRGEFRAGSFVSAAIPRSVAVSATGEVFSYAFDAANDAAARDALFRRIFDALVPGGVLLFDVAGPERARPGGPERTFAKGPDWAVLVETVAGLENGTLTRNITSFRRVGELYRRDTEVHRLLLLDPAGVLASLAAAGFRAQTIQQYGSVPLPPGVPAFLAHRPA